MIDSTPLRWVFADHQISHGLDPLFLDQVQLVIGCDSIPLTAIPSTVGYNLGLTHMQFGPGLG